MSAAELAAMSLQPLETPVLKVSRPVAACSRCRNAKIKCDGKLPACSSCEKNGRAAECTSTNDQFARGKERSYVSTLETRIDRLQTKLEEAQARKPSVVSMTDQETPMASRRQSEAIIHEPPTPNTSRKLKRKEVSAIDDLVSDFGFLSVNATARDFYGFTSAMSYARLVLSACSKDELPKQTSKALPARHVATALIQHYLDNIFVLLPMFDEATFYASVDNVYSQDGRVAMPLDHWTVRMVLAISSASMSEQRGDQHYQEGINHVCSALDFAESVLHPGNIYGVQALMFLTQYAMLDPHHFDSWSLIGAVSRAMADLGLHQDPPKGTPMSRGKLDLRRRVFHCIYALDRSTSLVQTRAFSFSDDSAKVKIPFHKQAGSTPTSPQPGVPQQNVFRSGHEHALDLINLRQIQSTWYTDLFQSGRDRWDEPYTYLWDKCDAMRKWFDGLSPATPPSLRAFFELDLLYSYVYVLSPSPRVPAVAPFAQKLIFEYCIRYADLMAQLMADPAYTPPLTFYDAMRVYMTGRQFLDVLQHNTDLLLDGFIPPHPEVKPSAAPPPPMPVVPLPPGETVRRFSTVRSINCIKNISRCLERFGVRFGYMSWSQRFHKDTANITASLHQRLRELDEMNGMRKQSMWAGSIGSIPSSNGSITYSSPPQLIAQTSSGFQQTPPPQLPQHPSFTESVADRHISPSLYPQQPNMYSDQQLQMGQGVSYGQPLQPPYMQAQQQSFSFNEPVYNQPNISNAPGHQFASWSGYGGPIVQDTLDEENANAVGSIPWNDVWNPMQQFAWNTFEMQAHNLGLPALLDTAWQQPFEVQTQVSPTSIVPPVQSLNAFPDPSLTMLQNRRISMQDATLDLEQPTNSRNRAAGAQDLASFARSYKFRHKGKGKAGDDEFAHMRRGSHFVPQAPAIDPSEYCGPGFTYTAGLGYSCIMCGRLCAQWRQVEMHKTLPDGTCVDIPPERIHPESQGSGQPERVYTGMQGPSQSEEYLVRTQPVGPGGSGQTVGVGNTQPAQASPPGFTGQPAGIENIPPAQSTQTGVTVQQAVAEQNVARGQVAASPVPPAGASGSADIGLQTIDSLAMPTNDPMIGGMDQWDIEQGGFE